MSSIGRPRRRHIIGSTGRIHKTVMTESPSANRINIQALKKWLKVITMSLAAFIGIFLVWTMISSVITLRKVADNTPNDHKAPALNFLGEVKPNQLQGEGDGRVNVLLLGMGGAKHPGGSLTDTIIVASFDPKNKSVSLLSVPRDLWGPIEGFESTKINAAYAYGEQYAKQTGGGAVLAKKTIAKILDLPIHYYVRLDFMALEKLVDALGGVTVDVENPIDDYSYPADDMIRYSPFRLKAGTQILDGATALRYARSRHASGAEGSDFARARRQQQLIETVKDKALRIGVLGNPKKINEIISILGNHVRTDISLGDMQRFIELFKSVDTSNIVTKVLDDGPDGGLVSHSGDARGYILLPRAGDYSEIQDIAHSVFTDPYIRQEKAQVSFVNATGSTVLGQQIIKLLTSYGYIVADVTPKDQKSLKITQVIDHTGKKPYTVKFLQLRFRVKSSLQKDSQFSDDIALTVGTDYAVKRQNIVLPKSTPINPNFQAKVNGAAYDARP